MYELPAAHKQEMIAARGQQFAAERYGHELTLIALRAQDPDEGTRAAMQQAEEAIAVLDKAMAALRNEAERLDAPVAVSRNGS